MADTAALVTGPSMGRAEATLVDARFLDLVTYRRSGDAVATPVLFAIDGDRILVRTAHDAGKLKRLRHTPAIEVAAADSRGRRLGPAFTGRGRILGPDAVGPTLARLHAKHRIAGPLFTAVRHLRGKGDVVIEISLEAAVSGGLCDLLPADQASEILGVPVLPGVAKTSVVFGGSSCRYVAADSTDSVGIQYTADHAAIVAAAERVAHRLLDALN